MKAVIKKIKFAWILIALCSGVSLAFVDDYFEISKNLDVFSSAFRELNFYYVDEIKPGELMKKGIDDMLESLDPYTNYIPESDIEDYRFMTTGQYGGIGATIKKVNGYLFVAEPYENFAAYKADLRAGDKLLEVDGKSLKDKSTDDVSKLLKGQPGTELTLKVEREGVAEPFFKVVKREEIKIDPVQYYGMLNDSVGYITLNQFTETASKDLKEAYNKLKEKNLKRLVLDLRGNPGGLLNEAVNICNMFLPQNSEIVSTKGKVKEWEKVYHALNKPTDLQIPIVVLVNSGSASASEIVSGTLQDCDRAVILGQRTYGKGLVQTTRDLSYNSKLKVTTAKYYTPSGRCIQAIDYGNRNPDGSVGKVSDSLMKAFKTKAGRTVYDGGGILPDVKTDVKTYSKIAQSIVGKNLVFDFATKYRQKHEKIASPEEFTLTEAEFKEFIDFLKDKEYDYTTITEKMVKDLEEFLKEEKYSDLAMPEYEALKKAAAHDKVADLNLFKDEIKEILEAEIVTRYYYQKGKIRYNISHDNDVKKAIGIVTDDKKYLSTFKL